MLMCALKAHVKHIYLQRINSQHTLHKVHILIQEFILSIYIVALTCTLTAHVNIFHLTNAFN